MEWGIKKHDINIQRTGMVLQREKEGSRGSEDQQPR